MKKYLSILLFTAAITGLTSCLKDDNANLTPDNSPAIVEFSSATLELPSSSVGAAYAVYDRAYERGESIDVPFQINYGGGSAAPRDIKLTIGTKPSAVAEYVAKTDPSLKYVAIPASFYELPTNVIIPAGQRKITIHVKMKTSLMTSYENAWILPISITDADGVTISGNYGTILAKIAVKNDYDGHYQLAGTIERNSAAGPDNSLGGTYGDDITTDLVTNGALNKNNFTIYWRNGSGVAGIDGLNLTINDDNTVVVKSTQNKGLANIPGAVNSYDPATKTFTLAFQWLGSTAADTRIARITLKYLGPR